MTLAWIELGVILAAAVLAYVYRKRWVAWPTGIRLASIFAFVALFAHVAWQAARFDERNEPVFHPRAVHWAEVPIPVSWTDTDFKGGTHHAIAAAMDFWNYHLGCDRPLFVRKVDGPGKIVVISTTFEPCGKSDLAWPLSKHANAGTIACRGGSTEIHVVRIGSLEDMTKAMIHEFGHAVWLIHDPNGMMAENTAELPLPWLPNPKDVRALRAQYCTRQQPTDGGP